MERPASLAVRGRVRIVQVLRAVPIRWRILSIAALNSAVVVVLAALIWNGAKVLGSAWEDVRQVRESDKILALLESETSRLQNLIHRYINQPSPELFAEILLLREAVLGTLTNRASNDPMLSGSVEQLEQVTDRFLNGFGELRAVQATIAKTYEQQVLGPARDMAGLYSIIEGATGHRDALIWPSLGKSREAFTGMLVAANAYYLSLASASAEDARRNTETIEKTIPVMSDLADNDLQRMALTRLHAKTLALREGLAKLTEQLAIRTELLRNTIDASQADAIGVIDSLSVKMRQREQKAQETFDRTLAGISRRVLSIAVIFLGIILSAGVLIALSIRLPLQQIMAAMHAITSGNYDRAVQGTSAKDEVGAMARAVEVFRENAIAKRKTEDELRASKEKAESALLELNTAQQNLIDAERLAALGGLVAGVAHEVNNPIGISLTVASSFARRAEIFETELRTEPLRRSKLDEFVKSSRDAAGQLVANLHRAGELIQSFKQVAVDRSHAERRQFSLSEATDQIVASLRPVLKKATITLSVDVPEGLLIDGYPGSYGQILTNLFLNAANHAFADGRSGAISLSARARGSDDVEIIFADDGAGMTPDVQRQAFDPFFTTRRNEGGTGLGLHIVYNLVTQQLGGRMMLESRLGQGTTFRIIMPKVAKGSNQRTHDHRRSSRRNSSMAEQDDVLHLIDDSEAVPEASTARKWKIAVIDDDQAVHEGTRFALSDYNLQGATLEILSAYSAAEGRVLMRDNPDIAAVLLDVIMETDVAGLDLVEYIRNDIKNETVRIILRTGQPGQAPERRVIVQYDINDYKAKTELTADKLFTSLTAALRSYQQLERMVQTRRGLEIIIDAASTLYDFKSMQRLAEGVLTQLASLLNVDCAGILVLRDDGAAGSEFSVLAGSGCYSRFIGSTSSKSLDPDLRQMVEAAFTRRKNEFADHRSVLYLRTGSGREVVVLLQAERQLSDTDRALVEIFSSRLSIAFDNVILYQQLHAANTQLEDRVAQRTRALMQANRRLSAQWLRLQRANGFKNEILGTVAHDLKNPLGVILGRTEMLNELIGAGSPKENVTAQVDHIRDATKRLTSMVDHLISDAMADAFDITIRREPVDVGALVAEVTDANLPSAVNKQQTISVSAPPNFVTMCDVDRIREAIDNLVSNAIKYSPIGGKITVGVTHEGDNTVVRITDEGAGLSPEDLGRLFGRFQRLSAKPTAGESSTGLGLSIVKRIIDMHGGHVTADSPGPGQGSTFTVTLPAAETS